MSDLYNTGVRKVIDDFLVAEAAKEKYPNFNGTEKEYKKLHKWVRLNFPKPAECDHCKTQSAKRYDWAAIENRYTKVRSDWEYLCRSCHIKSDGRINQLKKGLEGAKPWNLGKKMSEEARAKMSANHWTKRKAWEPRKRDKYGRFV